jgi:hypothetical protein
LQKSQDFKYFIHGAETAGHQHGGDRIFPKYDFTGKEEIKFHRPVDIRIGFLRKG